MTTEQMETAISQLQSNVSTINNDIATINERLDAIESQLTTLAKQSNVTSINTIVNKHETSITSLQNEIASIKTDIGFINKLTNLYDVNIKSDLAQGDIIRYDGTQWTNAVVAGTGSGSSVTKLSALTDVNLSSLSDGQVLMWSNSLNAWTNGTVSSSGSSSTFDVTAMWNELSKTTTSTKQIHPDYIKGDLSVSSLTTTNGINANSGSSSLTLSSSGLSVIGKTTVNGNLLSTGEITCYN